MKKAILYLRDKRKTPRLATKGLAEQEEALRKFCTENEIEVIKVYSETHDTIANGNRVFFHALKEVDNGTVKAHLLIQTALSSMAGAGIDALNVQIETFRMKLLHVDLHHLNYTLEIINKVLKKNENGKYEYQLK